MNPTMKGILLGTGLDAASQIAGTAAELHHDRKKGMKMRHVAPGALLNSAVSLGGGALSGAVIANLVKKKYELIRSFSPSVGDLYRERRHEEPIEFGMFSSALPKQIAQAGMDTIWQLKTGVPGASMPIDMIPHMGREAIEKLNVLKRKPVMGGTSLQNRIGNIRRMYFLAPALAGAGVGLYPMLKGEGTLASKAMKIIKNPELRNRALVRGGVGAAAGIGAAHVAKKAFRRKKDYQLQDFRSERENLAYVDEIARKEELRKIQREAAWREKMEAMKQKEENVPPMLGGQEAPGTGTNYGMVKQWGDYWSGRKLSTAQKKMQEAAKMIHPDLAKHLEEVNIEHNKGMRRMIAGWGIGTGALPPIGMGVAGMVQAHKIHKEDRGKKHA
jgi:opacity protein-like surface antigen